jgi:predicted transcriptional regulator of viral defense system
MEFSRLLQIVDDEPVFETGLLLAGNVDPFDVRRQLTRWTASGKIYQLRRGLYSLAPPYQKTVPHPFLIANRLQPGSYVSLQSALAYGGLIPEAVPVTTSITTGRPRTVDMPLGRFEFRHVKDTWFHGFHLADLGNKQKAFIATLEKALLDLIYLQPESDTLFYLRELRLQALEKINFTVLHRLAEGAKQPRLLRAVEGIHRLAEEETIGYEPL